MYMKYDFGVIGSGPGGYVAAIRAAQLGRSVVLIEEAQLGGVCLNWGCIPTKSLLKSAQLWADLSMLSEHGISVEGSQFDLKKMVERSREIARTLGNGVQGLMRKNGVHVIKGRGAIQQCSSGDVKLHITGESNTHIHVGHLILATGARPRVLPVEIPSSVMWTAKEAMTPGYLPKRLLVIGAGAIGMEFASFYQALGTKVTVVEQGVRILPNEDEECTQLAQKTFQKKGMEFKLGMRVQSVDCSNGELRAVIDSINGKHQEVWIGEESVDRILVAVGVVGNTEQLGLEHTKVRIDQGQILVDSKFQTAEPNIYAIGDVIGAPWLAHLASHQGISCIEHIVLGHAHSIDILSIPGCTYTLPPLASFGLTEEKAKASHEITVGRFSFSGNGQALAQSAGTGLIKLVFEAKTGELLGAHLFGKESPELLSALLVARGLEGTAEALTSVLLPHPTMSEMIYEAVLDAQGRVLHV